MSVLAGIHRELCDAGNTGYKHIVHIRVTKDAIPGSLVAVPVSPERARTLGRLLAVRDEMGSMAGVVADPSEYEKMLELLLHPADWMALLKDTTGTAGYWQPGLCEGEPDRVMGLPVSR